MALAKRMRTRKEQLPEEMVQGGGKQMVRKDVASKPLQQGYNRAVNKKLSLVKGTRFKKQRV